MSVSKRDALIAAIAALFGPKAATFLVAVLQLAGTIN